MFSVTTPAAEVAATSALETPHRLARRPSVVFRRGRVSEVLPDPAPLAALAIDASLTTVKAQGRSGAKFKIMLSISFYLPEDGTFTFDAVL